MEPGAETWAGGKLKQFDDQFEADREAILALTNAVVELDQCSTTQQANSEQLNRANGELTRNAIGMEKSVLDRVEAAKIFLAKDFETRSNDLKARLQVEFTESERLTKHLVGHGAPVLKPLVDEMVKAQMDATPISS